MQLEDEDFNDEVNNLIEWCEDLDYEKYIGNWHELATSAYSGAAQEKYNLTGGTAANNLQMLMMRSGLQGGQDLLPGGNLTGNTVGFSTSGGNLIAQDQPPAGYNIEVDSRLKNPVYGGDGKTSMQAKMMDLE